MGLVSDTKDALKAWQGLIGLTLGILLMFAMSRCTPPTPAPVGFPQVAQVNPEVKDEPKQDVELATPKHTVKAYGAAAKNLIALPDSVLADPLMAVTESSLISSSEKRQVLSSVLDTRTGETIHYVSRADDPWFAPENRGQLTFDYGYKANASQPVARANLRYDFLQTKAIHWGVSSSLYSDGDYFLGVGGSFRW